MLVLTFFVCNETDMVIMLYRDWPIIRNNFKICKKGDICL